MRYQIQTVVFIYPDGRRRNVQFSDVDFVVDDVEEVRKRLLKITYASDIHFNYKQFNAYSITQ